jgi:hypothetical protein
MSDQAEDQTYRSNLIKGTIGFLWLVGIILLYFVSHKPFTETAAAGLALAVWRIFVFLLIFSLAGGLGRLLARRLQWQPDVHPLAFMAITAGLGLGFLSLGILFLGSLVGLPRWAFWPLLILPAFLLNREIRQWWQAFACLPSLWQESSSASKVLAIALGLLMFATLLICLAPPLHFDSLVSHLVMPHAYLRQARITYLPWLFMSGMPQVVEVLYLPAITLGGDPAAALISWGFAQLTLLGLLGYLRQRFTPAAAWAGVAALCCGYGLVMSTTFAYVDWPGLFFGFAALVCIDLWRQENNPLSLLMSGVFIGLALGTKYTNGSLAIALAATLTWHCWKCQRKLLPNMLRLSLPALMVFSPWLVKNFLSTGNPVYPLLFPSGAMTPLRLQGYQGLPSWGNWQDILLLPIRATYRGIDSASGYGTSIGPLLLGFGGLAWIGGRCRTKQQQAASQNAAVTALAGIVLWVIGNQFSGFLLQTRYHYSLFPAFAVLAAAGYDGLASIKLPNIRLERILYALLLLVSLLNLLEVSTNTLQSGALQTILGLQTTDSYLSQNLGWYYPVMQHINHMPEGEHVLLFFEPRSLYCAGRCTPDELMDRWKRDWDTLQNIPAIQSAWRAEGFTHFLYYQSGVRFMRQTGAIQYTPEEWQALDNFLAASGEPLNFDDVYLLYALP